MTLGPGLLAVLHKPNPNADQPTWQPKSLVSELLWMAPSEDIILYLGLNKAWFASSSDFELVWSSLLGQSCEIFGLPRPPWQPTWVCKVLKHRLRNWLCPLQVKLTQPSCMGLNQANQVPPWSQRTPKIFVKMIKSKYRKWYLMLLKSWDTCFNHLEWI